MATLPVGRRKKSSSRTSVVAALIGDLLVAASKIMAAAWTGSAAMTSEAIHSVVDTTNEILLLYGIHRSKQKADADHPFGHGREIYFWSFVVSLLIFALGAGFAIYEGVSRILDPVPIEDFWRNLCGVRNYLWLKKRYERQSALSAVGTTAQFMLKSLLYDERPLRRLPWIVRFARDGRRDIFRTFGPREWSAILRPGKT